MKFGRFSHQLLFGILLAVSWVTLNCSPVIAAVLSGAVTKDGAPASDACVNVFQGSNACNTTNIGNGVTGVDGAYAITVNDSQQYYIQTDADCNGSHPQVINEYWNGFGNPGKNSCDNVASLNVATSDIANIDFNLATGVEVSGAVDISANPLAKVCVNFFVGDSACNIDWVAGGSTDETGSYTALVPKDSQYYVNTHASCQGENLTAINKYWNGFGSANVISCNQVTQPLSVAATAVADVDFTLETGVEISGNVTDTANTPLENICVNFFVGEACNADWIGGGTTDSSGNYTAVVPAGQGYYASTHASCQGGNLLILDENWDGSGPEDHGSRSCEDAELTPVPPVSGINFQLAQGGKITGAVSDENGVINGDLYDMGVNAYTGDACDNHEHVSGSRLGDDGSYSVTLPLGGQYLLGIWSNGSPYLEEWFAGFDGQGNPTSSRNCQDAVTLSFSQGQDLIENADFNLEKGGKITGVVSDENGVINGDLYNMGVNAYTGDACNNHEPVSGSSLGTDGSYSVTLPLDGQYLLGIWSSDSPYLEEWFAGFDGQGNPTNSRNCQDAVILSFSQGQDLIDNAGFNLEKGGRITGTVSDENGAINGNENSMDVTAFTGDACEDHQWVSGRHMENDGTYSITVPLDGQYLLRVQTNDSPYLEEWFAGFDGQGNPTSSQNCQDAVTLTFSQGQDLIGNIGFTLEKGGRITGTVSDGNGAINGDQYDMGVSVFTGNACENIQHVKGSGLQNDGTYSVTVPLDGQYLLKVYTNNAPYIQEWFAGFDNEGTPTSSFNCQDAVALSFNQGQDLIEHADFTLENGISISGTITDQSTGLPVGNIQVEARTTKCEGSSISRSTSSNEDVNKGMYQLLVPSGISFYIHTCVGCQSENNYLDIWYPNVSEMVCENAEAVTGPATGIDFALSIDTDGDGISDYDEEFIYHLDKTKRDTDGDGIDDSGELYFWGAAYDGDIDIDGLRNIDDADADGDGVSDLQELARGGDMKNPASTPPPLTLYDDFSSGNLDAEKWMPEEYEMVTQNGALQLFVDSPATHRQWAQTPATAIQNVKTTFTVNELARNDGGSVYFNLHGVYYHENSDPTPQAGRVYASMSVGDSGSGLKATYYIGRIIDETGQTTAIKSGSVNTPALTIGNSYKMEIRYDGTNGFIFTMYDNGGAELGTVGDTGPALGASLTDRRGLQILALDKGGKIGVSVESFETSNGVDAYTEYDGFESVSSSPLNPLLWSTPEISKKITDDNKLHLLAHSFGDQLSTRSYLKHRFNYIESKVKIDSRSFQTGATRGKIRLDGTLYNDSRGPNSPLPYNGNEGNIWGQVTIEYTESDGLYATAWVERVSNSDWTASEKFLSTRFNMPLSFDTEYILYIGFAGDLLIAGIDSADGTQHEMTAELIQTPKYLPFKPGMEVLARQIGNGGEGMLSATFDDIRVSGDHLEKAGDVNVDGVVDLSDAILGLRTMTGATNTQTWSAGDVNGDGIIGMPEVINIMHQAVGNP